MPPVRIYDSIIAYYAHVVNTPGNILTRLSSDINDRLSIKDVFVDDEISNEYAILITTKGNAKSNASVEKFKNDLAKNQPLDRVITVPIYGFAGRTLGRQYLKISLAELL